MAEANEKCKAGKAWRSGYKDPSLLVIKEGGVANMVPPSQAELTAAFATLQRTNALLEHTRKRKSLRTIWFTKAHQHYADIFKEEASNCQAFAAAERAMAEFTAVASQEGCDSLINLNHCCSPR